MDADWFQSIILHGIVFAKAAEFVQSAKLKLCTFVWFPPVAILVFTRFQRVMSQMKENKCIIKFIIYCF